jgi:hypothetical protein
MLGAINLDDKFGSRRDEINNVWAYRPLPFKLNVAQLLAPEVIPKLLLGVGHITTQASRERLQVRTIIQHRESPSIPLFQRAEGKSPSIPLFQRAEGKSPSIPLFQRGK